MAGAARPVLNMDGKMLVSHLQNVFTLSRCTSLLLCISILFLAFWIRVQDAERIPDGQFTETDGYSYYKLAQLIAEHGTLPDRDMSRWVPLGRDLTEILPFYSYLLAYSHKVIATCFPKVSLYHVCIYMPVICFTLGLGVLMLFFYRPFGLLFSSIIGVLLATLPGGIDRSSVGFGDRDSWCLLIGILAVTTYLRSLQTQHPRRRLFWTLASSLSVCIGGLSWGGFGIFLLIIMSVELWRFLTSETEEGLGYYALWTLTYVPLLIISSPVYRGGGGGFTTHVFTLVIIPPLVLFVMRVCRHLMLTKITFSNAKHPFQSPRNIALILTTLALLLALAAVLIKLNTFDDTTVSFSQSPLMQTIGELQSPNYKLWYFKFGGVFLLGSLGFLLAGMHPRNRFGHLLLAIPLILFLLTTFFREPLDLLVVVLFKVPLDGTLFFASIGGCVVTFVIQAWHRKTHLPNDMLYVAFCTWFFCWVALARNAERYDFFIGVAIVFFTAVVIHTFARKLQEKIKIFRLTPTFLKAVQLQAFVTTSIAFAVLSLLMFWSPIGAHAKRSLSIAQTLRKPLPGDRPMAKTIEWMTKNLEKHHVVAANWGRGNQLHMLGGVKTIIDSDHYIPHWIHLFFRHVYAAQSEKEALEFLYTHEATHLAFNDSDIHFPHVFSTIGSDTQKDRYFSPQPLQITKTAAGNSKQLLNPYEIPFHQIDVAIEESTFTLATYTKDGQKVTLPYVAFIGNYHTEKSPDTVDDKNGGVLLYCDSALRLRKAFYLSPTGWNSLIVRLYMREEHSSAFEPIYTQKDDLRFQKEIWFDTAKIWKIHYPPNIKKNPKYLTTEPTK
ncbi:hypothetical protein C6501_04240 [Candidatus Poribacteria bacterium]|nr:MAG: hypothetical protein C6501_04240 [Candidatus Poribacteria bacterium]